GWSRRPGHRAYLRSEEGTDDDQVERLFQPALRRRGTDHHYAVRQGRKDRVYHRWPADECRSRFDAAERSGKPGPPHSPLQTRLHYPEGGESDQGEAADRKARREEAPRQGTGEEGSRIREAEGPYVAHRWNHRLVGRSTSVPFRPDDEGEAEGSHPLRGSCLPSPRRPRRVRHDRAEARVRLDPDEEEAAVQAVGAQRTRLRRGHERYRRHCG
ncbi:hypothetical protein AAVH_34599, partial [Aphelenchoides avenae]